MSLFEKFFLLLVSLSVVFPYFYERKRPIRHSLLLFAHVTFTFVVFLHHYRSALGYVLFFIAPFLLILFFKKISQSYKKEIPIEDLQIFLARLLFRLRLGWGLRSALRQEIDSPLSLLHQKIAQSIHVAIEQPYINADSQENRADLNLQAFLVKIDKRPLLVLSQVESYLLKLNLQVYFLKQTQQLLAPPRAQAYLVSLLYVLLAIFVLRTQRWSDVQSLFALSLALFLLGQVILFRLGRRYKWKI